MASTDTSDSERLDAILAGTLSNAAAFTELRVRKENFLADASLTPQQRESATRIFNRAIKMKAPMALDAEMPVVDVLKATMIAVGQLLYETRTAEDKPATAFDGDAKIMESFGSQIDRASNTHLRSGAEPGSKSDAAPAITIKSPPALPPPPQLPPPIMELPQLEPQPLGSEDIKESDFEHITSSGPYPPSPKQLLPVLSSQRPARMAKRKRVDEQIPPRKTLHKMPAPVSPSPATKISKAVQQPEPRVPLSGTKLFKDRKAPSPPIEVNYPAAMKTLTTRKPKRRTKGRWSLIVKLPVRVPADHFTKQPVPAPTPVQLKSNKKIAPAPKKPSLIVKLPVCVPPHHFINPTPGARQDPRLRSKRAYRSPTEQPRRKSRTKSKPSPIRTALPNTPSFPPFPPLSPRSRTPFTKGLHTALDNLSEDAASAPTTPLLTLIAELQDNAPIVDDWERKAVLKGGEYVYEALKAVVGDGWNGDGGVGGVCKELREWVGREEGV